MFFLIIALAFTSMLLAVQLWRNERQLEEWAKDLSETDENSNLRLCTSVRSRGFLRACRAMNERLEKGRQARILQDRMSRELKTTISCVSHDIRTPLTGAAGYLQLLETEKDPEKQRRYAEVVRRRLNDLEGLLEELFLFTKLSGEEYHIVCEEMDPFPVFCEILAGFYQSLQAAGIEPQLRFPQMQEEGAGSAADRECCVYASGEALRRIFSNLIQNAVCYGSGGLRVEQEKERISFSNTVEHPETMDVNRLFEGFYRADPSRHTSGTGLGLASVKGLMEKMGGRAEAGLEGNTLTITLIFQSSFLEDRTYDQTGGQRH